MKLNPKADFAKFTRLGISPKRAKLDEGTRWQLASEAIEELRRHDGWADLDREAPIKAAPPHVLAYSQPSRAADQRAARLH